MSGDTIKEFLVGLGFDVEGEQQFTSAIGKATLVAVGLGAAAVTAAAGLFKLAEATADYFDNLGDLSNRTGIAVSDIEEFGYVAQLSGSSFETANASLEQFGKTAGDAANGMGRGKKVFDELGLSVEDSNGKLKDTTGLLFELGDKIKDMDKSKQTAIAERLGVDRTLIEAITTDVSGLRDEFRSLYTNAGLDSEKAAEKSGKFMDALDRFNFVLATVGRSLAVNFMDRFTDAMDTLRKLIVDSLPAIMRVLKPIINLVLDIADVFIALAYRAGQAVSGIINWIADLVGKLDGWVVGIGLVVAAWRYLNLAFLATPVGAILALIVAVGLLIDDFMTWKEGGDALVPWGDWAEEIEAITAVLGYFWDFFSHGIDFIINLLNGLVKLFSGDLTGAMDNFSKAWDSWVTGMSGIWGPVIDSIKNAFVDGFDFIFDYVKGIVGDMLSMITGIPDKIKGAFSALGDKASGALDSVMGVFGSPDAGPTTQLGADGGLQTSLPLPANQTVSQETTITVQAGPDAASTAKAVGEQQGQVNGDMARNLKGAVR